MPDIDAERDQHRILAWDMEPGDALFFHFRTPHGAPANKAMKLTRHSVGQFW